MRFTPSQDGRHRASVRISFRVGVDALVSGAAHEIWSEMVESDDMSIADKIAASLNRAAIVRATRLMLKSYGYSYGDALSDDDYMAAAAEAAEKRVATLWPELATLDD